MSEQELHKTMKARDASLGAAAGSGLGALVAHGAGRSKSLGAALGGIGGGALGGMIGKERALKDQTKQERHEADRDQAQEHRKELIKMRQKKASTLDGVMLAAMVDELQHIHQEKVAINLAGVGNFLGNVGGKAISGLTQAATKAAPSVAAHAPGLGAALGNAAAHAGTAANAVGGVQNLNRLAGGALMGGAALGAGGFMAGRATAPRRY